MGGGQIIKGSRKIKILHEMKNHPSRLVFLALCDKIYVGMVVCFWGYSTFRAGPALNIHDLIVLPAYRQKGVAGKLMEAVEKRAHQCGCSKITLEVRSDNKPARRLYHSLGYGDCHPAMSFWVKLI